MPLVFQYGSNCSRLRLESRLKERVEDLGRALTVEEFEIAFNKRRQESGSAAADLVKPRKGKRRIWGVLYEVSKAGFKRLKMIEGPSYRPKNVAVKDKTGVVKTAKTFRVMRDARRKSLWTSAEYVGHIVTGLRDHGVPEQWIAHVIDVAIQTNQRAGASAAEQIRLIKTL